MSSHLDWTNLVNKGLLYGFRGNFSCRIQRVVSSGQDGSILPGWFILLTWGASHVFILHSFIFIYILAMCGCLAFRLWMGENGGSIVNIIVDMSKGFPGMA